MNNFKKIVDENFLDDLKFIRSELIPDPGDWGLFQSQLKKEIELLDDNYLENSRETIFPPLSTYGYRQRYMQSLPLKIKQERNIDLQADYRIVFKVNEEEQLIFYFAIGPRIKGFPKDENDIWYRVKNRELPDSK